PNQASNCVQVGPDCTWVKSRILTPVSALPACPYGLLEAFGRPCALPLPFAFFRAPEILTTLRAGFFSAARDFALVDVLRLAMSVSSHSIRVAKLYFLPILLCGLRLPMRPDSLPAPGSIT